MNVVWGLVLVGIGAFFIVSGATRSQFPIYRLFVARSRILWGDNAYRFHMFGGALMAVFGIVYALGYLD